MEITDKREATAWTEEDFDDFFGDLAFTNDAAEALQQEDTDADSIADDHRELRSTLVVLMLLGKIKPEDVTDAVRIVRALR